MFAGAALVVACGDDGDGASAPSTPPSTPVFTKAELVIGNVGLYTGPFGPQYQAGPDALNAWTQWVNAHGGINGHPVRVVVRNDDGDPAKAITAVKELVEIEHVVALVGNNAGATDSTWRAYVEEKGIPVIGGLTLTQSFGTSPMFFPASSNLVGFVASQVNAAKLSRKKTLGAVVCAERASCQQSIPIAEAAAIKAGLKFGGAQTVLASSPNFNTQCRSLKDLDVDVLNVNTAGPVIERFVKDCDKLGYKPTYIFPGGAFQPSLIDDVAEGAYVVSGGPLWFGDQPNHKDFIEALKQYTKTEPDGFATRAWQAALLFGAAAANVSDNPTAAEVLEGLYSLKGETLGGWSVPLTFARGKGNSIGTCDWIAQVKDSKLTAPFGYDPVCA